jgi:hypothetical protein
MDELVRQVTINCAERGLLLLRVRDELRMVLSSNIEKNITQKFRWQLGS